jgi:hypothetical protein
LAAVFPDAFAKNFEVLPTSRHFVRQSKAAENLELAPENSGGNEFDTAGENR